MNTLVHRRQARERDTAQPPLRLLERWPRPQMQRVVAPVESSGWLQRSLDAYFAWGEGLHYAHRFGSWERLR